jgi:hypothetical protein
VANGVERNFAKSFVAGSRIAVPARIREREQPIAQGRPLRRQLCRKCAA